MAIQQLLQSKQGGIPPQMMALLELEQAKQALMQSGVAPGTVAGQKVQEAQMLTQPPQQPGMQDLMPGVQQRAGEMAQAQQPVTQAQLRQAMAQQTQQSQQPVMAAEGGIITLPADIEMAEGGIVGYNGETGSAVKLLNPEFDEEGLPRGKDERERIIDYNNKVRAAYEQQMKAKATTSPRTAAPSMQNIADVMAGRRQLEQFYRPRDPEAYTPEMVGFRVGDTTPVDTSVPLRMQDTRGGTPEMAALAQMLGSGAAPNPAPSSRPPAAPAAASAAPASGVASLMGPPEPAGSERQFGEAIAAAGRIAEPETITPEQLQAQREAVYRARGIDPDFAKRRLEGIERLKAMDDAAKAEYAQSKKDIAWENVATRLAARGGARSWGEGARNAQLLMAQRYGEQRKADQQFNQLMRVNEEARIKELNAIDDMNRALAEGDIGRAEKRKAEILEARNAKNMTEAKLRAQYAPQLLEAETAERRMMFDKEQKELDRQNNVRLEMLRRETAKMGGPEQDRIKEVTALKLHELTGGKPQDATPAQKLEALEYGMNSVRSSGKGFEDKAEISRLKLRASTIQNELKDVMVGDVRKKQLQAELDEIYRALGGGAASTGGATRPTSQAEFDALPKGARYINPADGKEYIKK